MYHTDLQRTVSINNEAKQSIDISIISSLLYCVGSRLKTSAEFFIADLDYWKAFDYASIYH